MVAGKVRVTMGFHKSPSSKRKDMTSPLPLPLPPPPPPPLKPPSGSAGKQMNPGSNQKPGFTRSFGVYFPRASAQVHNASSRSDHNAVVSELRSQVEELREREALLKTEVLEIKLLRESVSVIPLLESHIAEKNFEIEDSRKETARLAEENERLRREIERSEELRRESERREKEMEAETVELRKLVSSSLRENDYHALSGSQRFQGLMDASAKSSLIRSLKRVGSMRNIPDPIPNQENNKTVSSGDDIYRKDEIESHSMSNSEELSESSLSTVRSRVPRVPKPPPKRSFSSGDSTENRADPQPHRMNPPPPLPPLLQPSPPPSVIKAPPPPPPPPPPKSLNIASAKTELQMEVEESKAMTESQKEVETNSSSQESLLKHQVMYRCKKCRRIVAIEENIVPHEPGKGEECFAWKKRSGNSEPQVQCSSIFVEPMKWMQTIHDGSVEEKLLCLGCNARLGYFNWAGMQCSCGVWVNPAFQLHKSRLDECKTQPNSNPGTV